MRARTVELHEITRQLVDKLAGTEHEALAVRAAHLAEDLAGDVHLVCATLERVIKPALCQDPPAAPARPSDG